MEKSPSYLNSKKHDHIKIFPSDLENGSLVALNESILMQKNKTIGTEQK